MKTKPWTELLRAGWIATCAAWIALVRAIDGPLSPLPSHAHSAPPRRPDMPLYAHPPKPDPDDQPTEDITLVTTSSPAHANRVERYLDMGFSEVDAEQMALVRDGKGFYLYHGDVRRALENGMTHVQAIQIHA